MHGLSDPSRRERGPLIYRLTWWVARVSLRLFYRRIEVIGAEHLRLSGPVVLVANHPNYMVDPLAVATATRRQVRFIAKGPLLDRYPVLSRFLRAIGTIPIYRSEDDLAAGVGRRARNRAAFQQVTAALARGGAIGVFAEGVSHSTPHIAEIQTGAARMVLDAEALHDFQLHVQVVPVGIYFPHPEALYSAGVVRFGPALDLAPFLAQYPTAPGQAVRGLTRALREALRSLTLHVPDLDWLEFVEDVRALVLTRARAGSPGGELSSAQELRLSQEVVAVCERLRARDPAEATAYREEVAAVTERIQAQQRHGVRGPRHARRGHSTVQRARDAAALPVAMAGILFNAPPYAVPWLWSRWFVRRREKVAYVKFVTGVPAYLLWYGVFVRRAAGRSRGLALWLLLAGPSAGILGLRARVHRRRWLDAWRRWGRGPTARVDAEIRAARKTVLGRYDAEVAALAGERAAQAAPPVS